MYPFGFLMVVFIECLALLINVFCTFICIQDKGDIGPGFVYVSVEMKNFIVNYNDKLIIMIYL